MGTKLQIFVRLLRQAFRASEMVDNYDLHSENKKPLIEWKRLFREQDHAFKVLRDHCQDRASEMVDNYDLHSENKKSLIEWKRLLREQDHAFKVLRDHCQDCTAEDLQMGEDVRGNDFLYASSYAGVSFDQAASVAVALTHKGWRTPSKPKGTN